MEQPEPPVVTLVMHVLLSSLKQGATQIRVRIDDRGDGTVDFEVGGALICEMKPPAALIPHIVRRLGVMASLPVHGKGEIAYGTIHLRIGDTREAWFALEVHGHGPGMVAELRVFDGPPTPVA